MRSSLAAPLASATRQGLFVQPKLLALSGPLGKSEFRFSAPVSIGRDASNPICIDDPAVARIHCRIARQNDSFLLTDQDTSSGTFVNGIPVKQRVLPPPDHIPLPPSLSLFPIAP